MYTLVLIVIAHGITGAGMSGAVSVAATHFPVDSKETCARYKLELEAGDRPGIKIEVHCLAQ